MSDSEMKVGLVLAFAFAGLIAFASLRGDYLIWKRIDALEASRQADTGGIPCENVVFNKDNTPICFPKDGAK